MDAVTYPEKEVVSFIGDNIIPLRVAHNAAPLSNDFMVKWTPTLIVLDISGKEHYRTVGFLPVAELIPSLLLGMGKSCFDLDEYEPALEDFDRAIQGYPQSFSTPEAVYLKGITRYKSTHEVKALKELHEKLRNDYPASVWAQRSLPYRLL